MAHWERDGNTWTCALYPGWKITDTGKRGKRDRFVITSPDGVVDTTWHQAHMDIKKPMFVHARFSAEASAAFFRKYV